MPVPSQESQVVHEDLSGSWRTVQILLLAIRYVRGHVSNFFWLANAANAVNRPSHLMPPKLAQKTVHLQKSIFEKTIVHAARVCGQAKQHAPHAY